jgi:single-strand DNA-binding protein
MMADFSSVVIVGRLTRDPELKYVANGAPVCTLSVATSRRFTKADGQKGQTTTFVDVDVWRRAAELCAQFLKKGREILVTGSLRQDRWVDARTQQNRSRLKVVAQTVQFLGPKPAGGAAGEAVGEEPEPVEAEEAVREE